MAYHKSSSANQEETGQDSEPPLFVDEDIMDFSEAKALKAADKGWSGFWSWGKRQANDRRLP